MKMKEQIEPIITGLYKKKGWRNDGGEEKGERGEKGRQKIEL